MSRPRQLAYRVRGQAASTSLRQRGCNGVLALQNWKAPAVPQLLSGCVAAMKTPHAPVLQHVPDFYGEFSGNVLKKISPCLVKNPYGIVIPVPYYGRHWAAQFTMNSYTLYQIEHSIIRKAGKAIGDFNLIDHGDRIMVCLSGGKDSWTLLHVLKKLQCKAPVHFELFPVTIDPGFPEFNGQEISSYMTAHYNDLPFLLYESHINQIIHDKKTPGTSFCSFCARLRRGVLYTLAKKLGVSKIAIGHNADDFIETLLLNQFFNGQIKAMSPCLHADDGINFVIRPLCYVEESLITAFTARSEFPIIDVRCAGRQEKDMKRQKVKKLLTELDAQHPGLKSSLLHALSNIDVRHLMDKRFQHS